MGQYFPELHERSGGSGTVTSDPSNHARKADLKEATGIDTSTLVSKPVLTSSQTKVHNLDVDKLMTVPAD